MATRQHKPVPPRFSFFFFSKGHYCVEPGGFSKWRQENTVLAIKRNTLKCTSVKWSTCRKTDFMLTKKKKKPRALTMHAQLIHDRLTATIPNNTLLTPEYKNWWPLCTQGAQREYQQVLKRVWVRCFKHIKVLVHRLKHSVAQTDTGCIKGHCSVEYSQLQHLVFIT